MTDVATRIRSSRAAAGLTQAQLAALAGISQPKLSAYERGVITPEPGTVDRILSVARRRPSEVLEMNADAVIELAKKHHILRVKVFGSAVHGTDTPRSDIDFLVSFSDDASLLDQAGFQREAEELLGYPVDVVSDRAAPNPILDRIMSEAVLL
jgi:predicted nucleotidyltransferase/DNA-binding XRE family transcriptional regulator